MLTACPDCGGNLGKSASKCRCGWKSAAASQTSAASEGKYTPCAWNPACRYPGRLWVRWLQPNERICVIHYTDALQRDGSIYRDDVVPPKQTLVQKNVAGDR